MVRAQLLLALTCVLCLSRINRALDFQYHDYSRMTLFLQNMAQQYPQKAFLFEIGKSGQGRSLWALALSAYAPGAHILTRPEVKYIANMHGNEVVGLEMLLYLIEYLLTSPDLQVYQLMQRSRIWIMPSMNPDGLEISQYGDCTSTNGRYVLNNIDLNRNFPDYLNQSLSEPIRAAETNAIMSWIDQVPFVLSANYHGGAFIINIPFDRFYVGQVSISADDDVYQMLARTYVNRISETRRYCEFGQDDIGTVTRGADWYEVVGGMQDYGYLNYGTIEMTMEISCCKYPQSNQLVHYWNYNRDAMIELLFQAQRGVKGLILNEYNQPIPFTQVMIDERRPVVNVTPLGEFWRILLPGSYTLKVFYRGYEVYRQPIIIADVFAPLNLTIVIPTSAYQSYSNRLLEKLSPFQMSSVACPFSVSYLLFFLSLILVDDQIKGIL